MMRVKQTLVTLMKKCSAVNVGRKTKVVPPGAFSLRLRIKLPAVRSLAFAKQMR
jgi:hypothetical protein